MRLVLYRIVLAGGVALCSLSLSLLVVIPVQCFSPQPVVLSQPRRRRRPYASSVAVDSVVYLRQRQRFEPRDTCRFGDDASKSIRRSSFLSAAASANSDANKNADFAYQELKIILDALRRNQRVRYQDVNVETARAVVGFINEIVTFRRSTSNSKNALIASTSNQQVVWTLAFTTDTIFLPRDATVQITFLPTTASPNQQQEQQQQSKLLYSLVFGEQTMGLRRLDVSCLYNIQTSASSSLPVLQFMYDSVSMDAFGYEAIDLCIVRWILKGRTNVIETSYLDEAIWIERQSSQIGSGGDGALNEKTIWNVYVREQL